MSRIGNKVSAFCFILLVTLLSTYSTVHASGAGANLETIGIVSGSVTGTYARFAQDLSDVLDEEGQLRVLAILGKGSVQNIRDLLELKGVDLAIVQSDVLEDFRRSNRERRFEDRIAYITKLYNEEIHLIARKDILNINDLVGKTVNIGQDGSGTAMTASIILEKLGIEIETINMSNNEALEALKVGDIDAAFFVVGKPATYFREMTKQSGLHFVPIKPNQALADIYLDGSLKHADYPNLVPKNQHVDTLAVGAVLAVYRWRKGMERYNRVNSFINRFFNNIDVFQISDAGYHRKWQEVDIRKDLVGWQRFRAAQEWLDTHP